MTAFSRIRERIHRMARAADPPAVRELAEERTALKPRAFLDRYEVAFAPFASRDIRLLELGVNEGGSLLLWRDYFERGIIAGLDFNRVQLDDPTGRIHVYQGLQQDIALLDRIGTEIAPEGFDIIIDDCSHVAEHARVSFWHLYDRHLKPGGLYVIEDWGTGYYPDWPDGAAYSGENHLSGMVGFVKELVDEVARYDITYSLDPATANGSRLGHLDISLGQVFVHKPIWREGRMVT